MILSARLCGGCLGIENGFGKPATASDSNHRSGNHKNLLVLIVVLPQTETGWGGVDANRNSRRIPYALMTSGRSAGDGRTASTDVQAASQRLSRVVSTATRFAPARADVESLLSGWLAGTQCIELRCRITALADLPAACLKYVIEAQEAGRAWVAWSTELGPMSAWGDYDQRQSEQMRVHVMFIEWWHPSSGHHGLWARADPYRPTDWTFGRGDHWKSR
jgi:hypothetical protein